VPDEEARRIDPLPGCEGQVRQMWNQGRKAGLNRACQKERRRLAVKPPHRAG